MTAPVLVHAVRSHQIQRQPSRQDFIVAAIVRPVAGSGHGGVKPLVCDGDRRGAVEAVGIGDAYAQG